MNNQTSKMKVKRQTLKIARILYLFGFFHLWFHRHSFVFSQWSLTPRPEFCSMEDPAVDGMAAQAVVADGTAGPEATLLAGIAVREDTLVAGMAVPEVPLGAGMAELPQKKRCKS